MLCRVFPNRHSWAVRITQLMPMVHDAMQEEAYSSYSLLDSDLMQTNDIESQIIENRILDSTPINPPPTTQTPQTPQTPQAPQITPIPTMHQRLAADQMEIGKRIQKLTERFDQILTKLKNEIASISSHPPTF